MNTPSQFQAAALAGKYGFASQVSAEADASLEQQIESEKLDIHSSQYSYQRDYLDSALADELANGDPVEFARQYLAAARRSVLHALQAIDAPTEIIESVFAP